MWNALKLLYAKIIVAVLKPFFGEPIIAKRKGKHWQVNPKWLVWYQNTFRVTDDAAVNACSLLLLPQISPWLVQGVDEWRDWYVKEHKPQVTEEECCALIKDMQKRAIEAHNIEVKPQIAHPGNPRRLNPVWVQWFTDLVGCTPEDACLHGFKEMLKVGILPEVWVNVYNYNDGYGSLEFRPSYMFIVRISSLGQ